MSHEEHIKKAALGEKGLGAFPSIRVTHVLEDRNASSARGSTTYSSPFGTIDQWDTDGVSLALFDLDKLPHVAIGKEQAVNADASPEGRALAEKLAATPFADQKELAARVRPLGYSIVPLTPGEGAAAAYREKLASPRAGRRQYSVRVKSAKGDHLVQVLDYSAGAQKRGGATLRLDGRRIVVGSGASPALGSAEELIREAIDGL
ncbi:MAG TPA: hypothetical protein PLR99_16055 [Polyangiaceae bacterium]|nr:hypothetical protein [Polyangiaceae bacterium]